MKKIFIIGLFSLCLVNLAFAGTGAHALERASNTFLEAIREVKEIIKQEFRATSYVLGIPVSGSNSRSI